MIIVNKSELGAGTRGSSLGFDALRIESLKRKPIRKFIEIEQENEHIFWKTGVQFPGGINIDAICTFFERNINRVANYLSKNDNTFIFSADHSSTPLYLSALKSINQDERIGVIWIDAHGDLHSPYTTPSGNMHGMPLCIALGEDNYESKVREPNTKTIEYWERLKNLGTAKPKITYNDLVILGIRDFEKQERKLINDNGVYAKTVEMIRNEKINSILDEVSDYLDSVDRLFISFDVDCMDPEETSYGTGTPVDGGFNFQEAFEITDKLTKLDKKICFEMVEINPLLDVKNRMAELSLKIFENVTNNLNIDY